MFDKIKVKTPLHRAVIENDRLSVEKLKKSSWGDMRDDDGFTPLEVAQLLGRQECEVILSGKPSSFFGVQLKGESYSKQISKEDFEQAFGVTYRSQPNFLTYRGMRKAMTQCPFLLRCTSIARENHEWADAYKQQCGFGFMAKIVIKWIDEAWGYGAFAGEDLPSGYFIGEYTGVVRSVKRTNPNLNGYCLHYPTRFWSLSYFVIDSQNEGNETRFINHSDHPNLQPVCLVERNLLHHVFVTNQSIAKGTQLTFDYGVDYWINRKKLAEVEQFPLRI